MCPQFHMEVWKGIRITPRAPEGAGGHPVMTSDLEGLSMPNCVGGGRQPVGSNKTSNQQHITKRPQACFCRWPALLSGHLRAMFVAGFFNSWYSGWCSMNRIGQKWQRGGCSRWWGNSACMPTFQTPPLVKSFPGSCDLMLKHISSQRIFHLCL